MTIPIGDRPSSAPPKIDDPWGLARGGREGREKPQLTLEVSPQVVPARRLGAVLWGAVAATVIAAAAAAVATGVPWLRGRASARAEAAIGSLVLSSHPAGAQATVDGTPVGATPLALRLPAGAHTVVVSGDTGRAEQFSVEVTAGGSTARHVALEAPPAPPSVGSISVESAAAGAQIFVDGVRAGAAPVTVPDLTPGEHVVQLRGAAGTTERRINVVAGAVTALVFDAPAATSTAGWITFALPFDVQVFEGTTFVGANRGDRILVGAGRHTFDLVNELLAYRAQYSVVVAAGQTARLPVEVPRGTLSVNALPWAEVLIGGRSYGETPLANLSLPLGAYDVTLRHPTLGERVQPVTIRLGAPNRVSLDLRK